MDELIKRNDPTMIDGGPWQSDTRVAGPVELAAGLQSRIGQPLTSSTIVSPDLPEEWGGRPTGSSRRAIRMQAEYDKRREDAIKERATLQAMDIQQKQFEMGLRDQKMQEDGFYYERGLKEAEQKLQAQTRSEATAIIGGLNQLDPRSPDYQKNVAVLFGSNPLGAADPNVQKVASQYSAANDFYVNSLATQSEQQKKDAEEQAQIAADIETYGISEEEKAKMLMPNLPAGAVMYNPNAAKPVIARAKRSQEEAEEAKTEEKAEKKDFTGLLRSNLKAVAVYNSLLEPELKRINTSLDTDGNPISDAKKAKEIANLNRANPELAKAFSEARGAAAALGLPMIQNKSDLSKYKKGDRVLAPDGITVMLVP